MNQHRLFEEDLDSYLAPYAGAKLIVNESIMPLYRSGESGELTIRLMDGIKRIVSVRTATLDKTFTEGRDYLVKDGRLVIPEGSEIRIMPWSEYNPAEGQFDCVNGGKLIFGEANTMHTRQYAVTYEPSDDIFTGKYFPTAAPELARSREILGKREFRLAFYGDSITYGCNASGLFAGVPPYMPVYPVLTAEKLRSEGYAVDYYNPSIGGMDARWGKANAERYFADHSPDLTVIAFGMNDGTGRVPVADFIERIKAIVGTIRKINPDAEFILVATTLPNPLSRFVGLQEDYEEPLCELAKSEGCALLNMTELHRTLLARKDYWHMTGNNINHPSDFLARLYAQGVLALLGE